MCQRDRRVNKEKIKINKTCHCNQQEERAVHKKSKTIKRNNKKSKDR